MYQPHATLTPSATLTSSGPILNSSFGSTWTFESWPTDSMSPSTSAASFFRSTSNFFAGDSLPLSSETPSTSELLTMPPPSSAGAIFSSPSTLTFSTWAYLNWRSTLIDSETGTVIDGPPAGAASAGFAAGPAGAFGVATPAMKAAISASPTSRSSQSAPPSSTTSMSPPAAARCASSMRREGVRPSLVRMSPISRRSSCDGGHVRRRALQARSRAGRGGFHLLSRAPGAGARVGIHRRSPSVPSRARPLPDQETP